MALSPPRLSTLKTLNWGRIMAYANPQSVKDLDVFLDKLPSRAGIQGLIAAGCVWAIAGIALVIFYNNAVDLRELHKQITQAEALRPSVPVISFNPVTPELLTAQTTKMKDLYKNLSIETMGDKVTIKAASTRDFASWRAAMGDLAYGGPGWRLKVQNLCAGRDCKGAPLEITVSVQQLDISVPQLKNSEPS